MTLYYFDHAASAPRREEVFAAMEPYLHGVVGNPSGTHQAARASRRAIEEAREEVASFVGVTPGGVIFTGGGTESCHLALSGVVRHARRAGQPVEIVTSPIEHHAVLETAEALAREDEGVSVRVVPVDADGVVDLGVLDALLNERTALCSVMTANNETGVIEPVNDVGDLAAAHSPRVVTHTDAVAAAPWLDLATVTASVDLVSICAHKLGGPVNAGALLVRRPVDFDPVVSGGGQERGRRGGTVDVAAAVGLAAAVRLSALERIENVRQTAALQARLEACVGALDGVRVTAPSAARLPGHVHLTVTDVVSDELLFLLDQAGVCASAASSCASGAGEPSHVLAAMGVSRDRARGAVRFTLGPETTAEDVGALERIFAATLAQLRRDQ